MLKELKERGWVSYYKNTDGTGKYFLNTTLKGRPKPESGKPDMGFPKVGKSESINKKDSLYKKDIYKGVDNTGLDQLLDASIGDKTESSTRYSKEQILELLKKGAIRVNTTI